MQLNVKNIKKYFTGDGTDTAFKTLVLNDINFEFQANDTCGNIISILAPFGAGKSTLFKVISALEKPSDGEISLNGRAYNSPEGKIAYIPEKPSSFPWLNTTQNIEFAFKSIQPNKDKVNHLIDLTGLSGYENHTPVNKSFGFRFRIALARAIAVEPEIILIDDSFKNMKPVTRRDIYELVLKIKEELKINFLVATTNIHEAIILSDEILLMKKDPGTIFNKIDIRGKINRDNFIINDSIITARNEIESYFRGENTEDSISFSI
jgi:ABC-type nitrate/sulfonate/bicarbonate transport system ATPase subunit